MLKFFFLPVVFLVGLGCKQPDKPLSFFPINPDSLIDSQLRWFSHQPTSLKKITSVSSSVLETELSFDKIKWGKELEPFRALSLINKPVYRYGYEVSVSPDPKSNLTIKSWTAKNRAPIRMIRIFYLNTPDQVKRIEASLEEKNFIFVTQKELQLEFSLMGSPIELERYKIAGYQKYFWGSPGSFSLEAFVRKE